MGVLRELRDPSLQVVGIVQLAESVLEVRGSGGHHRFIYLSGARTDEQPAIALLPSLVDAIVHHVDPRLRAATTTFFRRVLIDAMRAPHGSLIAVLPRGARQVDDFSDGILLDRPVNVPTLIDRYRKAPSEETRSSVQGTSHLLAGMLSEDGITLMDSEGTIIGFHVFLRLGTRATAFGKTLGGARKRAYQSLASSVGQSLVAAFVRSQDGGADVEVAPENDPIWTEEPAVSRRFP
jgi:hypothetical protein